MTPELAYYIAYVEKPVLDPKFHPRQSGIYQGFGALTQTEHGGTSPIPSVLDQRVAVDRPPFVVLVKEGVVAKTIAQSTT